MAQFFEVHPTDPQPRLIHQAAKIIEGGGVIALPTDSSYAFAAHLDDKDAVERIRRLRGVDERHHMTLLCRDLSAIANHARVDNRQYRLIKSVTPGPYTFILEATKEVPRRVSHPQRRTIGIRIPAHAITLALLARFGDPLLSSTLIPAGESEPLNDPLDIRTRYERLVELVIDGGAAGATPTTVIDLTPEAPVLIRRGGGALAPLGLRDEDLGPVR